MRGAFRLGPSCPDTTEHRAHSLLLLPPLALLQERRTCSIASGSSPRAKRLHCCVPWKKRKALPAGWSWAHARTHSRRGPPLDGDVRAAVRRQGRSIRRSDFEQQPARPSRAEGGGVQAPQEHGVVGDCATAHAHVRGRAPAAVQAWQPRGPREEQAAAEAAAHMGELERKAAGFGSFSGGSEAAAAIACAEATAPGDPCATRTWRGGSSASWSAATRRCSRRASARRVPLTPPRRPRRGRPRTCLSCWSLSSWPTCCPGPRTTGIVDDVLQHSHGALPGDA